MPLRHSNTNIHIQHQPAWMVIQLQPAVWKQIKKRKKGGRGRWRMEISAKRNMVGSSVLLPRPNEHPRQIFCEWEHILGGYTFTQRRRGRRWLRGESSMMSYEWKMVNQCVIEDVKFGSPVRLVILLLYKYYSMYYYTVCMMNIKQNSHLLLLSSRWAMDVLATTGQVRFWGIPTYPSSLTLQHLMKCIMWHMQRVHTDKQYFPCTRQVL